MNFWNKETLNCLKNSNLKVDFAGNGQERLFIFVQWKVYENSSFFVFSEIENQFFLVCLALFLQILGA